MTIPSNRLNGWLFDSPVSAQDLSLYRILYALLLLFTLWRADYVGSLPPASFNPPSGPFALLAASPPIYMVWSLQAALCVSLAALVIGWRTRFTSVCTALLLMALYGIGFSYGKVDHVVFLFVVPLLLSFSSWGSAYSVDSYSSSRNTSGYSWAPRCLAVAFGVGMLTAGLSKLFTGWLSWETQATWGYFVRFQDFASAPLDQLAALNSIRYPSLWEIADYSTVILECGVIFAACKWPAFYLALAGLAIFHMGIFLTLGIAFSSNLVAYAAFIPWSKLGSAVPIALLNKVASALAAHLAIRCTACVSLASLGIALSLFRPDWLMPTVVTTTIFLGGIVGLYYLGSSAWRLLRAFASRRRGQRLGVG